MRACVGLVICLSACGPAPTMQEMYSGAWAAPTPDVMRTLATNGVRGCGEFYQKANSRYQGEFAVACNRMPDGSGRPAGVGYLVWTGSGQVQGPDLTAVWMHFGGPPRPDPR